MAKGAEVLSMLCPDKEWVVYGDDYDSIEWIKGEPISKADFDAGFAKVDEYNAEKQAAIIAAKEAAQAKLEALGLTTDDLKALGL